MRVTLWHLYWSSPSIDAAPSCLLDMVPASSLTSLPAPSPSFTLFSSQQPKGSCKNLRVLQDTQTKSPSLHSCSEGPAPSGPHVLLASPDSPASSLSCTHTWHAAASSQIFTQPLSLPPDRSLLIFRRSPSPSILQPLPTSFLAQHLGT